MKHVLLLCPLFLSGCITVMTTKVAQVQRQPQKVHQIKDVYTDSSGATIINFTARLSRKEKDVPLHIRVPLDKLLMIYDTAGEKIYDPSPAEQETYGIIHVHTPWSPDTTDKSTVLEFSRSVLQPGFYQGKVVDTVQGTLSLPASKTAYPYYLGDDHWHDYTVYGKRRDHIVFLYAPVKALPGNGLIAISIERSAKRRYGLYALMPLTVGVDAVTIPLQVIWLTAVYITAPVRKEKEKKEAATAQR
jgi:hypothetical protein